MTARHDQFHLLMTEADWRLDEQSNLYWDDARGGISLRPVRQLYRRAISGVGRHRGAARDRTGTWYWVAADGQGLLMRAPGAPGPSRLWPPLPADAADPGELGKGDFHPLRPPTPDSSLLQGLTITADECLVAGLPDSHSLLTFDLRGTARPVRLGWPEPFQPIAMAPTPGGGLMILEGAQSPRLWQLDRDFRAVSAPVTLTQPSPLALAVLPDGSALVLSAASQELPGVVTRYQAGAQAGQAALTVRGHHLLPYDGAFLPAPEPDLALRAYDIAFLPDPESDPALPAGALSGALYVATEQQEQCFVFRLAAGTQDLSLTLQLNCLPTRRSRGIGIAATADGVYYDSDDNWVPLLEEAHSHFEADAEVTFPQAREGERLPLGFDGKAPDCVWHRIFLDASIPPGTSVRIATRAINEGGRQEEPKWQKEQIPLLRPSGSELPGYRPVPGHEEQAGQNPHAGTWEVLLQNTRGRYLQVRLTLNGSGQASPRIYALRAYYPRFSYVEQYLPGLYQDNLASMSFLERFLANPEGILTDVEQQLAHSFMHLDPRTAPPEYLHWLVAWFGLSETLGWEERRQRLLVAHAMQLFRSRGTRAGLIRALRLGTDPEPTAAIFTDDVEPDTGYGTTDAAGRPAFRIVEELDGSHRFTVYLTVSPNRKPLDADLVRRLVMAERPAHTQFDVLPEWAAFRVGSAHLGADTILAKSGRLTGMVLGQGVLGESYLTHDLAKGGARR